MKRLEPVWPLVNVSVDIDLSEFGLPDGQRSLQFEFIDPVWAWVRAACKQPASEMQWVPKVQCVRGLENHVCYGGGLQFGEAFAEACRSCPRGTRPMHVNLLTLGRIPRAWVTCHSDLYRCGQHKQCIVLNSILHRIHACHVSELQQSGDRTETLHPEYISESVHINTKVQKEIYICRSGS